MAEPDNSRQGLEPGSVRELLHIALPLMMSAGSLSIMNVIDRVLLTRHSADELAACMPAALLHWTVISLAVGTVMYANAFVAQYEGAGRRDRVSAVIWQAAWVSVIAGLVMVVFIPFSPAIFALIGHHPDLQPLESDYFSVLCAGSIPVVLANGLSCFFSGRGKTMVVLWVNVLSVITNAVLDYLLIFGIGAFPEMGIRGAALATVIARGLAVVLYAVLMFRGSTRSVYDFRNNWRINPELLRRLVRFGLPNGFQFLVDIGGFSLFIFLVGGLGKTELAATSLAFNLNSLAFVPLLGVGTAVMTLVGNRVGEQRPELAVRTTWTAFLLSGAWMLGFGFVFVVWPDVAIIPYVPVEDAAKFQEIRDHVVVLLRFVATYSFFDAMAVVFSHAVRGAGDTRFSFLFTFASCWSLMVVPTWIISAVYGGHLLASWTACTVYIVVIGFGFMARFQAGKWRTMTVMETPQVSDSREVPSADLVGAVAGSEPL